MQEPQLKQLLLLFKDMLRLQTSTTYTVANRETLAAINLRLNNTMDAVNIYYTLFKELGGKTLKYIDNAIKTPTPISQVAAKHLYGKHSLANIAMRGCAY